jgi:hypothetical protein
MGGNGSKEETGHAVQVAARLDHLLLALILTHLDEPKLSRRRAEKILNTFGMRRRLARDLDLIDEATEQALKLVNDVRVVFAHAEKPITFRSRYIEEVAGKDARRVFDEAASRAECAIEERRNRIVYGLAKLGIAPVSALPLPFSFSLQLLPRRKD